METKQKESDAGEDVPAADREKQLRRELLDGPLPGPAAVKGAGVELATDEALVEHFGGDPERDIHPHIVLSET